MRFSLTLAVATLVSTVSASIVARQSQSGGLPECALKCIATANFGPCQATDNACLCKNQDFVTSSTDCIVKDCKGDDLQKALNASKQLCAAVGVTLTSTPAALATATATTGSASGTTSSAAAASTSSTPNGASMNGISTVAGVAALLAAIAL